MKSLLFLMLIIQSMKQYMVSLYQHFEQKMFFSKSFVRSSALFLILTLAVIHQGAYAQCVNTPKLTSNGASAGTSGTAGICLLCSVTGAANLLDADLTNFATISIPVGVGGSGYVSIKMGQTYPAGTRAGFVADVNGGLAGLLNGVSLTPYLNGVAGTSISAGSLINILGIGGGANVSAVFCQSFDEIRISAGSLAGVLATYKIYYAYVDGGCSFPVQCGNAVAVAEICGNGIDDDGDGLVDNEDSDCTRGPGCVTANIKAWYKANAGISVADGASVSQWNDQTANGFNISQSLATSQPTYYSTTASKLVNFNPTLSFDGGDELKNLNRLYANTSAFSLVGIGVDKRDVNAGGYRGYLGVGVDGNYPAMDFQNDGVSPNGWNPWMSGSSPAEWSGGSATVYPYSLTNTAPNIAALTSANTSGGSNNIISYVNGFKEVTTLDAFQTNGVNQIGNGLFVGSSSDAQWLGLIPEIVAYDRQLTDTEMQKVQSYFAIKYGATTEQDYLSSTGTVLWNKTSNTAYHYDVAGIGREDCQNLYQKQSKSGNIDEVVTISGGTTISTTNASNNASIADGSFMIWGSNNLSASFGVNYTPNSYTPIGGYYRMTRVWKVQETGTVGAVVVGVPQGKHLLVSTDPTFASGVTEVALTADANGNMTASYNFTSGQYFTFGNEAYAPGCVAGGNIKVWLKADAGISGADGSSVSTWTDQSLSGYNVAQTVATSQPKYYSTTAAKLVNFNPTLDFDGADDHLKNLTPLMSSTTPYTFMGVGLDEAADIGYRALFSSEEIVDYFILYKESTAPTYNGWTPYAIGGALSDRGTFGKGTKYSISGGSNGFWNGTNFTSDATTQVVQPQIVGMSGDNVLGTASRANFFTWTDGYKDSPGNWSPTDEGVAAYQSRLFKAYAIGADMGNNGAAFEFWKGRIPEVIAYDRQLTDAEMQKVNTYFGIKYGITLGQGNGSVGVNGNNYNYVRGDGTVIWDATANATYKHSIAGIGRDDCQSLYQKQAKSVSTDEILVVSGGTAIVATNATNNASLTDKSFIVWGSNGLSSSFGLAYAPTSYTPAGGYYRMNRVWKVQETGTVGAVVVGVPDGKHLLVSTDPTFASGVTEVALTADANGNMTASYNFTSGQYFTFGNEAYAPGCVAGGNIKVWLKADAGISGADGSSVSTWTDQSLSGYNVAQTVATSQPKYYSTTAAKLVNFNPTLDFDGADDHLKNLTPLMSSTTPYTFMGVGLDEAADIGYRALFSSEEIVDYFILYKESTAPTYNGWTPYAIGGALSDRGTFGKGTKYSISGGSNGFWNGTNFTSNATTQIVQPQIVGMSGDNVLGTASRANFFTWTDGYKDSPGNWSPTDEGVAAYQSRLFKAYAIGADMGNNGIAFEFWKGRIPEVIAYDRQLTDAEMQRVNTYFGIKYGVTLGQGNGYVGINGNNYNYVRGDGTVIWNATTNSAFKYRIFGIGRDDCQGLNQKQSKSVSPNANMVIGIDGQIGATNAANTGAFNTDKSFLVVGDNNLTGITSITPGTNCTPESVDKATNEVWAFVESGTVESTKVSLDLSTYGFNASYPVYMQVASDAAFTNVISNVLMVQNGPNYETTYDFTGTQYVRFAGNTTPIANLCSGDKVYDWNVPALWTWGQKTRTSTIGDQTFTVTITDPSNAIFIPTIYPVGQYWWDHIFIPRYDANGSTNVITTKIALSKPAAKASFEIFDMDEYFGKDVVNVYGKLAGVQVNPKFTFPSYTALSATGTKVSATTGIWDILSPGRVFVNFNSPVDEIYVEYTKDNGWAFKSYQDIRIKNINVTCKAFVPEAPIVDNVYIAKEVATATPKVGEAFTYKFTVKNLDCNPRTINFTDNLPAGLKWVDSTLTTSMTYTTASAYGGSQALSLTGLSVPTGDSYIYIDAIGTAAGTFNNQASYVVNGNSYLSDDPAQAGATNPTPVTLVANSPLANLTFTKTVDKSTAGQNQVLKYTYTITNPNASAVLTSFQDNLPASAGGSMTYVASTLTGIGSATVNPTNYGGESSMVLTNLSIPANGSLTFTVNVNTGTFTTGQTAQNVASVTPDPTSGYRQVAANSTLATTLIGTCVAGTTAPTLSATSKSNVCPAITANINSLVSSTCPSGSSLEWHTVNTLLAVANKVADPTAVGAGTYYPTCFDATNACYSPVPTTGVTVTLSLPCLSTPPVQTATGGQSKTGNAATELVPAGGTAPYVYSNGSSDPLCVAPNGYSPLPVASNLTVTSSTGAYTYTAPSTPGNYYFCIKVCDSSTPTAKCSVATYTLTVTGTVGVGTILCSSTQMIPAPVAGTPSNHALYVTLNVTTAGTFTPVTVTGSGFTESPSPYSLVTTATGNQVFIIPVHYDGTALTNNLQFTIGTAGSCTADMTKPSKVVSKNVYSLDGCTAIIPGTLTK